MKRVKGCTGKVRHASMQGAYVALKRSKNVQMNVYSCPHCKGWHIGRSRDPMRTVERIDQLLKRDRQERAARGQPITI